MPETCRAEIEKNGMAKNILNKQEKASFSFIQLSFIMITFFWLRIFFFTSYVASSFTCSCVKTFKLA